MSININNSSDPFYRYKRDKIVCKNKHNNTEILNLHIICRQLCCSPKKDEKYISAIFKAILKTISKNLGTNIKQDKNVVVLKGNFDENILENILNNFIQKHILCPKCSSPEYNTCFCSACGYTK